MDALQEKKQRLESCLREIGSLYVALDLGGCQIGSMNRTLSDSDREEAKAG